MHRIVSRYLVTTTVALAALVSAPRAARAYDVEGVAIGADVAVAGPTGLALSVGLGRLELDFIVGFAMTLPEDAVLVPGFSGAGGIFFTLTDATQTNLQIGGRIGTIAVTGGDPLSDWWALTLEADLRVEHRFDEHFAINLQVGIGAQIWPDDNDPNGNDLVWGLGGTGLVGGAGFRYWFDALGGGGGSAQPQARPAPAPAPTGAPASESSGGQTPYWEQ